MFEFSRLMYGMLGNKRIPLPACVYVEIKKEFPVEKHESYAGFDLRGISAGSFPEQRLVIEPKLSQRSNDWALA